jgi:putative ABC transport system permease protein
MLALQIFPALALRSLLRNRLQTALALLGVSIGVGALVTSIALGRGAQQAIDDQLRAAGANMIVVTSGNYQPREEQHTEGAAGDEARLDDAHGQKRRGIPVRESGPIGSPMRIVLWRPGEGRLIRAHFEDDPTALHNHPTAKERLGDAAAGLGAASTLTREDADAIRREIQGIQHVASGVHENARVYAGSDNKGPMWFTRLHGTEADLSVIRTGWTFPHGSFLTQREVAGSQQVMVLGRVVADRLFGADNNPVGRDVRLWNQAFRVTGVIGSRSWASQPEPGDDQFDAVYVPVTTMQRLLNLSKLNTITVTTLSVGDTTGIAKQIIALLRRRHHIRENMADDFIVKTLAQQVLGHGLPPALARVVAGNMTSVDQLTIEKLSASLRRANRTMLGLLAGVATVSLLVGGVGVMNLLLLSVTQRTREVGVRIALGARCSDVAAQFVFEAALLCVAGGLLGTLCGVLACSGLGHIFHWSTVVSPLSVVLAMMVAALIGLVSGVYPARCAAQLDPIEALRHE